MSLDTLASVSLQCLSSQRADEDPIQTFKPSFMEQPETLVQQRPVSVSVAAPVWRSQSDIVVPLKRHFTNSVASPAPVDNSYFGSRNNLNVSRLSSHTLSSSPTGLAWVKTITETERKFVRDRIRKAYLNQLGLKGNRSKKGEEVSVVKSKLAPRLPSSSAPAAGFIANEADNKHLQQLLDMCVEIEEEFLLNNAPSRLDYFKQGVQYEKVLIDKQENRLQRSGQKDMLPPTVRSVDKQQINNKDKRTLEDDGSLYSKKRYKQNYGDCHFVDSNEADGSVSDTNCFPAVAY